MKIIYKCIRDLLLIMNVNQVEVIKREYTIKKKQEK